MKSHDLSLPLLCVDTSPVATSPAGLSPSGLLARQLQDSWRTVLGRHGGSPSPVARRHPDSLLFEVTDASVVQDGSSKYVVGSVSRRPDGHKSQTGVGILVCQ